MMFSHCSKLAITAFAFVTCCYASNGAPQEPSSSNVFYWTNAEKKSIKELNDKLCHPIQETCNNMQQHPKTFSPGDEVFVTIISGSDPHKATVVEHLKNGRYKVKWHGENKVSDLTFEPEELEQQPPQRAKSSEQKTSPNDNDLHVHVPVTSQRPIHGSFTPNGVEPPQRAPCKRQTEAAEAADKHVCQRCSVSTTDPEVYEKPCNKCGGEWISLRDFGLLRRLKRKENEETARRDNLEIRYRLRKAVACDSKYIRKTCVELRSKYPFYKWCCDRHELSSVPACSKPRY